MSGFCDTLSAEESFNVFVLDKVAARVGVPRACLREWLARGESGDPEFVELASGIGAARERWLSAIDTMRAHLATKADVDA